MLDYGNLSFISAQNPYVALLRSSQSRPRAAAARRRRVRRLRLEPARALQLGRGRAAAARRGVPPRLRDRATPFWATMTRGSNSLDAFVLNDRGAIYVLDDRSGRTASAIWSPKPSCWRSPSLVFVVARARRHAVQPAGRPRAGLGPRAASREVRASFYRKLFLAFVAAAVVPVLALALVSRAYMANADARRHRERGDAAWPPSPAAWSRICGALRRPVARSHDDLIVWLSRVVAQDVNIFDGPSLLASSERNLFASGLLPTPHAGRGLSRDLARRPAVVRRPRARRRSRVPGRRGAGAARRPRGDADVPLTLAAAGDRGADRRARSPRAAGRGALHHARRRHRLLHGRAHRRSGQPADARDAAHRARRSRRARAGDVVATNCAGWSMRSTRWPTICSASAASWSAPTAWRRGPTWRGRWRTTSRTR